IPTLILRELAWTQRHRLTTKQRHRTLTAISGVCSSALVSTAGGETPSKKGTSQTQGAHHVATHTAPPTQLLPSYCHTGMRNSQPVRFTGSPRHRHSDFI